MTPCSILNLREQEAEAFAVYRDKINSLIGKLSSWNQEDISELFRDQVLPEINLIEKKIKDWKTKTKGTLKDKILFGSGAVSIGLYSGLLPPNILQLVATIGGTAAMTSALIDYNKTLKTNDETRSSDLYFLWQANK